MRKSIWKAIQPYVPQKILSMGIFIYYKIFMRILCWYIGFWDKRHIKQSGFTQLPPASLRHRVHVSTDINSFLKVGKKCSQDIENALMKIGKNMSSFEHILDFGCGCGRTLIWFANHSQSSHFYGADIDIDAISWCRSHLDFARFSIAKRLPPLEYPSGMFDLIFAVSVFTHLNEDSQFHWLRELKRIAKPNGILLLTVHGRHYWSSLPPQYIADIKRRGMIFIPVTSNSIKGISSVRLFLS